MLIDLTLKVTREMIKDANENEKITRFGHLGTHFDVMDKEFPLEYTRRKGIVFDVTQVSDREIGPSDIDTEKIEENMFVAFSTGFMEKAGYGTPIYFHEHPSLSNEVIDILLKKKVSVIGIDCAGLRRGKEHPLTDKRCADENVFVVENLTDLKKLCKESEGHEFYINTYPVNFEGMSGLPCRVIAEILKK